ncbi:MAG: YncE family protein [Armatimonadetes bacterium]|nr:YncE family protein [Armatimonadota bacterium]
MRTHREVGLLLLLVAACGVPALAQEREISECRLTHWSAFNPQTGKLYVAAMATANVAEVDMKQGKVVASIPVGRRPEGIAVNPKTNRIYVSCALDDKLVVIDGQADEVLAKVDVPAAQGQVAANPETNRVYVACMTANELAVVDGEKNEVASRITLRSRPAGVAVDTKRNRAYVAGATDGWLTAIDGQTNEVAGAVAAGIAPFGVAVDETTGQVLLANTRGNTLSFVDGDPLKYIGAVALTGTYAISVTVDDGGRRAFVGCLGNGVVNAVDLKSYKVTVALLGIGTPVGLAYDADAQRLYVAHRDPNWVTVTNPSNGRALQTVKLAPTQGGQWPDRLPGD